jgi:hypothetical protein
MTSGTQREHCTSSREFYVKFERMLGVKGMLHLLKESESLHGSKDILRSLHELYFCEGIALVLKETIFFLFERSGVWFGLLKNEKDTKLLSCFWTRCCFNWNM